MKKLLLTLLLFVIVQNQVFAAKEDINTVNAPSPIGTYSQAIKTGETIYLSGQIAIVPSTGKLISDDFKLQVKQVLENIRQVVFASGGELDDIKKLTVYLTDLSYFDDVNQTMKTMFKPPYPARSAIEVKALPKGAKVEIEAIMTLDMPKNKMATRMKPKVHGARFMKLSTGVDVSEISPKDLFMKIEKSHLNKDKLTIIDVREESEWLNDPKVEGVIHLSKGIIERDIEKVVPNIKTPIIVYCSGGFRSRLAADALQKMGYGHVLSLKGGMRGYQEFLMAHNSQ